MSFAVSDESPVRRGATVRLLLWDYARGSLAYELALLVVLVLLLLVPGCVLGRSALAAVTGGGRVLVGCGEEGPARPRLPRRRARPLHLAALAAVRVVLPLLRAPGGVRGRGEGRRDLGGGGRASSEEGQPAGHPHGVRAVPARRPPRDRGGRGRSPLPDAGHERVAGEPGPSAGGLGGGAGGGDGVAGGRASRGARRGDGRSRLARARRLRARGARRRAHPAYAAAEREDAAARRGPRAPRAGAGAGGGARARP